MNRVTNKRTLYKSYFIISISLWYSLWHFIDNKEDLNTFFTGLIVLTIDFHRISDGFISHNRSFSNPATKQWLQHIKQSHYNHWNPGSLPSSSLTQNIGILDTIWEEQDFATWATRKRYWRSISTKTDYSFSRSPKESNYGELSYSRTPSSSRLRATW